MIQVDQVYAMREGGKVTVTQVTDLHVYCQRDGSLNIRPSAIEVFQGEIDAGELTLSTGNE